MEDGRVTLIASTTENPHFYVYNAILSRSSLFEFKPVDGTAMVPRLRSTLDYLNGEAGSAKTATDAFLATVGNCACGDVRHAIVLLENAFVMADDELREEHLTPFVGNVHSFNDDSHYDLLSALQKSIRGSDPDAAVFYLATLLNAGELLSVCRRLQVIASEDVGLAYPLAAVVTRACCESARELGMPEAQIPLANAAVLLATATKSNSACVAVETAMVDAEAGKGTDIPTILQSPLFQGYRYPHDYPNHYVDQQYLPESLRDRRYYTYGANRTEQAAAAYAKQIREEADRQKGKGR
jgi:putative ATPase